MIISRENDKAGLRLFDLHCDCRPCFGTTRITLAETLDLPCPGRGVRAWRFVFVPPNLDGFMTVHRMVGHELDGLRTAVHIRTSERPRRFEPFHHLGFCHHPPKGGIRRGRSGKMFTFK